MSAYFEITRELDNELYFFRTIDNICHPHFHSNIELVYVVDGNMNININGQSRKLTKGCLSIANSYDIHSYYSIGSSDTFVIIIPVSLVSSYMTMTRNKVFSTSFIDACENTQQIELLLNRLNMKDIESIGRKLIAKGTAYHILGLLCDCVELIDKPAISSTDLARKILVYLQQNYLNPLSIDTLAKHLGYNKDYLSRFFNSYLGCGFSSYINGLRSRHAASLMTNGQTDLTEVAFSSGFENYRTFNRAFQQSYGMNPSEYKRNIVGGKQERLQ